MKSLEISPATNEKPPDHLYRYRSVSERTKDIIVNARHFLAPPLHFNDPFDYAPVGVMPKTGFALQRALWRGRKLIRETHGRGEAQQRFKKVSRKTRNEWEAMTNQVIEGWRARAGVVCFTEDPANLLMWGHYAESHQGICLEFRTRIHRSGLLTKVLYQKDRPKYVALQGNNYIDSLSRKAEFWSYEREWRVLVDEAAGQYLPYDPPDLIAIILGAKIPPECETQVRGWIADRQHPVAIKRACLSRSKFELDFIPA